MSTWKEKVARAAVRPKYDPARPRWDDYGVPWCDRQCPYYDDSGEVLKPEDEETRFIKWCALLKQRPGPLCQPVVIEMARLLEPRPAVDNCDGHKMERYRVCPAGDEDEGLWSGEYIISWGFEGAAEEWCSQRLGDQVGAVHPVSYTVTVEHVESGERRRVKMHGHVVVVWESER